MDVFTLIKSRQFDELANMDFDPNIRDENNNYLITYAILYNEINVIKLLFDKGVHLDILDQDEKTILYLPIKFNYYDIIELLIKYSNNDIGIPLVDIKDVNGFISLHYAIQFKNTKISKLLLNNNSDPNIPNKEGLNSLHIAVQSKSIDICKLIIPLIKDINAQTLTGETALHIATSLHLNDIIELLLNIDSINIDLQDYEHELTPLHYAISSNNIPIVKILLKKNANPNIQSRLGMSSLHYALTEDNKQIFKILTSLKKLNANLTNYLGEIPLHIALKRNMTDSFYLQYLIDKSNLNLQDNNENSCLHLIVKLNLWKTYDLSKKKLNILLINREGDAVIDLVPTDDFDKFIDLVVASFQYIQNNSRNSKWIEIMDSKQIKNKIIKLLNKYHDGLKLTCHDRTYPIKKSKQCIEFSYSQKHPCYYTGNTLDILVSLIYLLKKHNSSCSTLTKDFSHNAELCKFYKSNGIIINDKCEFLNFEIVWIQQKLFLINDFFKLFTKCKNKKRFIIIPIGIELSNGSHANYLIYDKTSNEIERFEPQGNSAPNGFNYNAKFFDAVLKNLFISYDKNIKYIKPSDYEPKIGFQMIEKYEINYNIGDPLGFCAAWSIWYVDMRITYNSINRKKLIKKLFKTIRMYNLSFRNLIRNYSYKITELRDQILSDSDMDINDWINDNYSDNQINSITSELIKLINSL